MNRLFRLLVAALLPLLAAAPAFAVEASLSPGAQPLDVGSAFPDVPLAGQVSPEAATRLGIAPGKAQRPINALGTEVLVVEIFSMYCPYCQAEAKNVNALFGLLQKSKAAGKVRMLGIGAGNTPFEVDFFRDKHQVPFPMFPDQEFICHKALNGPGTPYFMLLKADGAGGFTVVHSHLGAFGDPGKFLDTLLAKAGIH